MGLDWGRAAAGFAIGASTSYAQSMDDQREWERQMRRDEVNDTRTQHFESIRASRDNEWKEEASQLNDDRSIKAATTKNERVMDAANLLHENKESRAVSASGRALSNARASSDYASESKLKEHQDMVIRKSEEIDNNPELSESAKKAMKLVLFTSKPGDNFDLIKDSIKVLEGRGGGGATEAETMSRLKFVEKSYNDGYNREFKISEDKAKAEEAGANAAQEANHKLGKTLGSGSKGTSLFKTALKGEPPQVKGGGGGGKVAGDKEEEAGNVKEPGASKGSVKITPEEAAAKKESSALWSRWKRGEVSKEELDSKVGTGLNLTGWKKKEKAESNKRVKNMVKAIESGKQSNEVFKFAASEEEIARVKEKLGYQ